MGEERMMGWPRVARVQGAAKREQKINIVHEKASLRLANFKLLH
jgi:hypothetical protein